ncbi:hypothetical protein LP420_32095 [Massilia sp. B-10]|nr:hypothetical protein LP420_32095 [Massilia sp. B-10]
MKLVAYEPFGAPKSTTFGNNLSQTRTYDLDGRLARFSLAAQTMAISYDAASRITGIADVQNSASGSTYGYDVLDRLNSVITPSGAQKNTITTRSATVPRKSTTAARPTTPTAQRATA